MGRKFGRFPLIVPNETLTGSAMLTGNAAMRGISTMLSGTAVVSVSAPGAVSGSVIFTQVLQYTSDISSQAFKGTIVQSVRSNAFEIWALNSMAPVVNMPVAWMVVK